MHNFLNRKFIYGPELDAFLLGAKKSLTTMRTKKIKIIRLSVRLEARSGIEVIHSLWGRPGHPNGRTFSRSLTAPLPNASTKFNLPDWARAGELIGRDMIDWVDDDEAFALSEVKTINAGDDVWNTWEGSDLVEDMLFAFEKEFNDYFRGGFQRIPRRELVKRIEKLMTACPTIPVLTASTVKQEELVDGSA